MVITSFSNIQLDNGNHHAKIQLILKLLKLKRINLYTAEESGEYFPTLWILSPFVAWMLNRRESILNRRV